MSITDIQEQNTRLKAENDEYRIRIYALRAVLAMPLPAIEHTLGEWHRLLAQQDRDRPPGELPDFSEFMKDTDDAKF